MLYGFIEYLMVANLTRLRQYAGAILQESPEYKGALLIVNPDEKEALLIKNPTISAAIDLCVGYFIYT